MKIAPADSALLLRCADAAGYGAVSFGEDDSTQRPARRRKGLWRAFLSMFFILL